MTTSFPRAGINISPNDGGLPGLPAAKSMVGALMTLGLIACVAGVVLGAIWWAIGARSSNPHHAEKGKQGVLASGGAAILIGSAVGLVNFFSAIHLS
ncbi:MAG TPA: DUF6112 family protein [Rhodopila sp.]|nr:DUF6112 family protein [Rhodopila sp.]